jgi:hypothetical protein
MALSGPLVGEKHSKEQFLTNRLWKVKYKTINTVADLFNHSSNDAWYR